YTVRSYLNMQDQNSNDKIKFDGDVQKEPTGYILGTVKPGQDVIMGVIRYVVAPQGNLVRQSPKNSRRKMHKLVVMHKKASQNANLTGRLEARDTVEKNRMFKKLEAQRVRDDSPREILHPKVSVPHQKKILTPEEVKANRNAAARARDIAAAERKAAIKAKKKNRRKMAK